MKRLLALLLALALFPPALAETGVHSGYLTWTSKAALVNGQAYGMTSTEGWRARTTVYAQTEKGMEVVWTGEGRGRGIAAWGDKLLMVTEKPKGFWQDMLELKPTRGERFVQVLDPATWETEILPIPDDGWSVLTMNGELVREAKWREEGLPHVELCRWNGEGWDEFFTWTGNAETENWFVGMFYHGFVLLEERRSIGGKRRMLHIANLEDGREYLLTNVEGQRNGVLNAVLDNGILYLLGDSGLWAFNLAAGSREMLLPGVAGKFVMNDSYIVFCDDADSTDNKGRLQAYDRKTATLLQQIAIPGVPMNWLLEGGTVYLQYYSRGGYIGPDGMQMIRPSSSIVELTTGECHTTFFDY